MAEKVTVTPDKRIIVAGAGDIRDRPGYIKLWRFDTGAFIRSDRWPHYELRSLLTTPDSRSIVVSGRDDHTFNDGTYYIWSGDITTGKYTTVKQGYDFSIDLFHTWDKQFILFGEQIWDWRKGGKPIPRRFSDPLISAPGKIVLSETHTLESTDDGFVVENFQSGEIVKKTQRLSR